MKRIAPYLVTVAALAFIGCRESESGDGLGLETVADQQFSYSYVKNKVDELEPGMTEQQVLFIIGTPAGKKGNIWQYKNIRRGLLIPSKTLNGEFIDGRYTRYWFGKERL